MGVEQPVEAGEQAVSALVAGLVREFGRSAGRALAARFLDAEAVDFHWNARAQERWLGPYDSPDQEEEELDRIAICGRLDGAWFAAICIVDGEGRPHAMTGRRRLRTASAARKALADAR